MARIEGSIFIAFFFLFFLLDDEITIERRDEFFFFISISRENFWKNSRRSLEGVDPTIIGTFITISSR